MVMPAAGVEQIAAATWANRDTHHHHQYLPKFSGLAQNWEAGGDRPSVAGFIEDLKGFGDKAGDSVGDS
jgi:hypothetical protein